MLSIVVPPDPLPIDPLGAGSTRPVPSAARLGRWCGDPWPPEGHGHAVWIEA
ncbi:MAG: hypothetical protein ACRDYA_05920 [Egibacteraceae bacterium]